MADEVVNAFGSAFRDYVTEGVPSSGRQKVKKSEVREAAGILQAKIDTINAQIDGAEVGAIMGAETVSALNALATELELDASNKGRIGRVYNDADAANNGDWLWSGTAFIFVGLGELRDIRSAVEPPFLSFAGSCIYDPTGVYGSAEAFYVPRSRWIRRDGEAAQGTLAANTTKISGYIQLNNPSPGQGWCVYYDMDDATSPYKAAGYPNGLPSGRAHRVILIAILRDRDMVFSAFDVLRSENLQYDHLYFTRPIVIQRTKVLVPSFYYRSAVQTWTLISPADGSAYWEMDFFTSDSAERVYFDERAHSRGEYPIKRVTGSTSPLAPSFRAPLILKAINGFVESKYPLAGLVPGGTERNQFVYGKGGVDMMPTRYGDTSFADVTNGNLTAYGLTRGITNTVNGRPYGGGYFKEPLKAGQSIFCRIFVQSGDVDNFGGGGRLYLFVPGSTSSVQTLALTLEKRMSSGSRIYSGYVSESTLEGVDRFWLGMEGQTVPGYSLIVSGLQIAVSNSRVAWIDRYDFPQPGIASELLYPDAMYVVEGRPLAFYPRQVNERRDDAIQVSIGSLDGVKRPYLVEGDAAMSIDALRLGTTLDMVARNKNGGITDRRLSRSVAVRRVANRVSGSKNVLMIGDSLTNYGMASCVNDLLGVLGMTPTFIGKYNSALPGESSTTTGGPLAEGHPGWEWGDFTYAKTDRVTTISVGGEAAYEALSKTDKLDVNTWLRNEVGSEASARNGKVFDPEFWRTRWAVDLAIPDVVCINIGTNDERDNAPPATYAGVLDGLGIVIPALRAAWPSAEVILYSTPMARTAEGDQRWEPERAGILRTILGYVHGLADVKVNFVGAHAHASQEIGYPTVTNATTAAGTLQKTIDDTIHFHEIVQRQVAECVAAAIAYEVGTPAGTTGMLNLSPAVTKTLVSDTLDINGIGTSYIFVDTEAAAATDNLATILGGEVGTAIVLQTATNSRDVTVVNSATIVLAGAANVVLDSSADKLVLIKRSTTAWHQVSFSNNG